MQEQNPYVDEAPAPVVPAPSAEPCRFFAGGNCRYGQECRYSHNITDMRGAPLMPVMQQHPDPAPPPSAIACRFFAQGNCKFGNKCRFYHSQQAMNRTQNRIPSSSSHPPPGSPCRFFAQGRCRYGQDCRFSHDLLGPGMIPGYQMGGPQGYQGYGGPIMMDPAIIAQVEAELALEAEIDAAIDATLDAQIRAEEEALIAEQENKQPESTESPQPQTPPTTQEGANATPTTDGAAQAEKSG